MKNYLFYIASLILIIGSVSCKKKYETDFIGPQGKEEIVFTALDSLNVSATEVDFSNGLIFFTGRFDKSITWKLTIEGTISGATKTFVGTSAKVDSLLTTWRGEQDALYYFIDEPCTVTLSDYYPVNSTLYNSISNNSEIISPKLKLVQTSNITILKPKPLVQHATNEKENNVVIPLFPVKYINGGNSFLTVAYDSEQCSEGANVEASPDVLVEGSPRILSNDYLPFSKNGGPINRRALTINRKTYANTAYYFKLKGQDTYNNDYYIGRVEKILSDSDSSKIYISRNKPRPEDIWFNVFIYGTGDGSKCNFTLKEDDILVHPGFGGGFNTNKTKECNKPAKLYDGLGDDAFEKAITLDFTGWKLFSFRYSDFDVIKDGPNGNGSGDKNPDKLYAVQFSLVASKPGGAAQVVFDFPTMTIGGPLKY